MKKNYIFRGILTLFLLIFATISYGKNCSSIRDEDEKNMCRGVAQNKPAFCLSITDRDYKEKCRRSF